MSLLDELTDEERAELTSEELAVVEAAVARARARAQAAHPAGTALPRKALQSPEDPAGTGAPEVKPFTVPDTSGDQQSWDDYWSQVEARRAAAEGGRTEVIRGVRVHVPTSLPLRFDRDLERMESGEQVESIDDVKRMLRDLFGVDVLDRWIDAGMHGDELRAALLWGISHGKGKGLTIAQAHEAVVTEGESLRAAAPQNRADRRAKPAKRNGKPKRGARGSR